MPDYSSPEDEEFFAAVGRLTISWSHLELGLDSMIFVIHHALGNSQFEAELPRALGRKLSYLRDAFDRLPIDESDRSHFKGLFDQVEQESHLRHDMIHGAVIEHIAKIVLYRGTGACHVLSGCEYRPTRTGSHRARRQQRRLMPFSTLPYLRAPLEHVLLPELKERLAD